MIGLRILAAWLVCGAFACSASSRGDVAGARPPPGSAAAPIGYGPYSSPPSPAGARFPIAATCGNGRIDPGADEECDGADFGAATCGTLRLRGGVLRCTPSCDLDTSGCDPCAPESRSTCVVEPVEVRAGLSLALAGADAEIAVAWTSAGPEAPGVRVARFDGDLRLVEESLLDARRTADVALARSATGYVLAASFPPAGVLVQPLDSGMHPRGPPRWIEGALRPKLVGAAAGAQPARLLLLWFRYVKGAEADTEGAVIGEDGEEVAPSFKVVTSRTGAWVSGVLTGQGFLLAADAGEGPPRVVSMMSVGLDGRPGAQQPLEAGRGPELAWTGSEARVVYHDELSTRSMRLGAAGRSLAPAETILAYDHVSGGDVTAATQFASPVFVWGELVLPLKSSLWDGHPGFISRRRRTNPDIATLALLRGTPPQGRLAPNSPQWVPITHEAPMNYAVTRMGNDVVMGWISQRPPRRLVLVRVPL